MDSDVFEGAFAAVIGVEGGLNTDPSDRGGLTKYGISQRSYPDLDIRSLTLDQAKQIYRKDYWDHCRCGQLDSALAICVFDAAVNEGQVTAINILQGAVRVPVDGHIGPITVGAAHTLGHEGLVRFMADRAFTYAHTLDFEDKGHGWLSRLFRIYEAALKA